MRTEFQDAFSDLIVTLTSAAEGAALGAIIGLNQQIDPAFRRGPFIMARNFAAVTGVYVGISCVMRRFRVTDDVQTSMVAGFGSGVMCSKVLGYKGAASAITDGVSFALFLGGLSKVQEMSKPPAEDAYTETRSMLSRLGIECYEKNFKKGVLTDSTLPLLTDSALRDVSIPPGPRLLILDHIRRNKVANEGGRRA